MFRLWLLAACALLLLASCRRHRARHVEPGSAAAACWEDYESRRTGRAIGRAISSLGGGDQERGTADTNCRRDSLGNVDCTTRYTARRPAQTSSDATDAAEQQRCMMLEQEERADRRQRKAVKAVDAAEGREHSRRAEAERREQERERDQKLAEARRRPNAPDVGGTRAEAWVICRKQQGNAVSLEKSYTCKVGNRTIFICTVDEQNRFDRCDTYFEDGDLEPFRREFEARYGSPINETVSANGFRVWTWRQGSTTVALSMYDRGVRTVRMLESAVQMEGATSAAPADETANPYTKQPVPSNTAPEVKLK